MSELLEDPVIMILIVAFIICIIVFIIGVVTTTKKNKKREPMYKTKLIYNEVLEQYMIETEKYLFGRKPEDDIQATLLKEQFPVGMKNTYEFLEDKLELTVASHRKIYVPSVLGDTPYRIYFKEYESVEFPRTITISNHKVYKSIVITEEGFELNTNDGSKEVYNFDFIKIEHLNEFVSIFQKDTPKTGNELMRFTSGDNRHQYINSIKLMNKDYEFLSEVLQKYCDWAWK